jgi:hypothetical protein
MLFPGIHRGHRRNRQRHLPIPHRHCTKIQKPHRSLKSRWGSQSRMERAGRFTDCRCPSISFISNVSLILLRYSQAQFSKASVLTGEEFMAKLNYYANAWLPARDILISSMASSANVDHSGQILLFEQFLPWKVCSPSLLSSVLSTDWLNPNRNTFSSWNPNLSYLMLPRPFTSSTRTTQGVTGASKRYLCRLRALRAAKHCRKRGGA